MTIIAVIRETETWSAGSGIAGVVLLIGLAAAVAWMVYLLRQR